MDDPATIDEHACKLAMNIKYINLPLLWLQDSERESQID